MGRSLKTSFMDLSNDQSSASESEPESLVVCRTFSGTFCVILMGVILIGSAGCSGTGNSANCGVSLTLLYLP